MRFATALIALSWAFCCPPPRSVVFDVPDGHEGAVWIVFGVEGAPPLNHGTSPLRVTIPEGGVLTTSSPAFRGNYQFTYRRGEESASSLEIGACTLDPSSNDCPELRVCCEASGSRNGVPYYRFQVGGDPDYDPRPPPGLFE